MKKILLIFALLLGFSFSAFSFLIDKKILDTYFEAHYPLDINNNPIPDYNSIYYTYNYGKTNTITMYALYFIDDDDKVDVNIQIYTDMIFGDEDVKEISFFNDDFIVTFESFSGKYNNSDYSYISVFDSSYIRLTDMNKRRTIKMFQNGNVQMMYNYKGKTYKYPIDDKTSSMVAKMLDLGFKK
ncbi:hypothetical protein R4K55_06250 [Brachyspira alvinipulli]|uniref:hypothetical protein n=1 Tax=Brachyspira alvinipulli TaxID=84379 RepID=UPI003007E611